MQKPQIKNHKIPYDIKPQYGDGTVFYGQSTQNQKALMNAIYDWFQTIVNYMHLDSQMNEKYLKSIEGKLDAIESIFLNLVNNNFTSNLSSNFSNLTYNISNYNNETNATSIIKNFFSHSFKGSLQDVFKSIEYDDGINCNCHCPKNGEMLNIFYGIGIGIILFFTILNFALNLYSVCTRNKKPKRNIDINHTEEVQRFVRGD
jgi:hypothetical protein